MPASENVELMPAMIIRHATILEPTEDGETKKGDGISVVGQQIAVRLKQLNLLDPMAIPGVRSELVEQISSWHLLWGEFWRLLGWVVSPDELSLPHGLSTHLTPVWTIFTPRRFTHNAAVQLLERVFGPKSVDNNLSMYGQPDKVMTSERDPSESHLVLVRRSFSADDGGNLEVVRSNKVAHNRRCQSTKGIGFTEYVALAARLALEEHLLDTDTETMCSGTIVRGCFHPTVKSRNGRVVMFLESVDFLGKTTRIREVQVIR